MYKSARSSASHSSHQSIAEQNQPGQTDVYISELMCVTHNNPMQGNQSTTLQIMKANQCKASQSKTLESITAQTQRKRCISQRAQVRHTNHIKVLQSKTDQGRPMRKSGSSCASHLRAILLILPTRRQQIKAPRCKTKQSNAKHAKAT